MCASPKDSSDNGATATQAITSGSEEQLEQIIQRMRDLRKNAGTETNLVLKTVMTRG